MPNLGWWYGLNTTVEDRATQSRTGRVPERGDQINVSFVAQMGDIIDGSNRAAGFSGSALKTCQVPEQSIRSSYRNPRAVHFSRADLAKEAAVNLPGMEDTPLRARPSAYFSFLPHLGRQDLLSRLNIPLCVAGPSSSSLACITLATIRKGSAES
jgi:hypothetical protein